MKLTSHIEFHLPVPNAETTNYRNWTIRMYIHMCTQLDPVDINLHAYGLELKTQNRYICMDRDVHNLFD